MGAWGGGQEVELKGTSDGFEEWVGIDGVAGRGQTRDEV
jgi:hypothetical protein